MDTASVTSQSMASSTAASPTKGYEMKTHAIPPVGHEERQSFSVTNTVGHRDFGDNLRFCAGYPRIFFQTTTQITMELMVDRPAAVVYQCIKVPAVERDHEGYLLADSQFEKEQSLCVRSLIRNRDVFIQKARKRLESKHEDEEDLSDVDENGMHVVGEKTMPVVNRASLSKRVGLQQSTLNFESNTRGMHTRPRFFSSFQWTTPQVIRFHAGFVPKTVPLVGLDADSKYEFFATVIEDSLVPFFRRMIRETILGTWASLQSNKDPKVPVQLVSAAGKKRVETVRKACTETNLKFPFPSDTTYPSNPLYPEIHQLPQPWNLELLSESLAYYIQLDKTRVVATSFYGGRGDAGGSGPKTPGDEDPPGFHSRKLPDPETLTNIAAYSRLEFATLSKFPKFLNLQFLGQKGVKFTLDRPNCMVYWMPVLPGRDELAPRRNPGAEHLDLSAMNKSFGELAARQSTTTIIPNVHLQEHDFSPSGMDRTQKNEDLHSLISSPGDGHDDDVFEELDTPSKADDPAHRGASQSGTASVVSGGPGSRTGTKQASAGGATAPALGTMAAVGGLSSASRGHQSSKSADDDPRLRTRLTGSFVASREQLGRLQQGGSSASSRRNTDHGDAARLLGISPIEQYDAMEGRTQEGGNRPGSPSFEPSLLIRDRAVAAGNCIHCELDKGFIHIPAGIMGNPIDLVAESIPDTGRARSAVEMRRIGGPHSGHGTADPAGLANGSTSSPRASLSGSPGRSGSPVPAAFGEAELTSQVVNRPDGMKLKKMFDPLFSSLRPRSMMPKPYRLFMKDFARDDGRARSSTSTRGVGLGTTTRRKQNPNYHSVESEADNAGGEEAGQEALEDAAEGPQTSLQRFALRRADIERGSQDARLVETLGVDSVPEVFPFQRKVVMVPDSYGYGQPPEHYRVTDEVLRRATGSQKSLDVELQDPPRRKQVPFPIRTDGMPIPDPSTGELVFPVGERQKSGTKRHYDSIRVVASSGLTYPIRGSAEDERTFVDKERQNEVVWSALDAAIDWDQDAAFNVFVQNGWNPVTFPWHRAGIDESVLRTRVAWAFSVKGERAVRPSQWTVTIVGATQLQDAMTAGRNASASSVRFAAESAEPQDPSTEGTTTVLLEISVSEADKKIVVAGQEYANADLKSFFDSAIGYQLFLRYSPKSFDYLELIFHSPGVPLFSLRIPPHSERAMEEEGGEGDSPDGGAVALQRPLPGQPPVVEQQLLYMDRFEYTSKASTSGGDPTGTGPIPGDVRAFLVPYELAIFHEAFNTGAPLKQGSESTGPKSSTADLQRRKKMMSALSKRVRTQDEEYLFIVCKVCGWKQKQNPNLDFQRCKRCGKSNATTYPSIVRVMERLRAQNDTDAEDFLRYVENKPPPADERAWSTRKFQSERDTRYKATQRDNDVTLLGFKT
ncbi:unnamed protein product [Amoebophrya sp. A25]|nr:unnamed protein product [Amoebophrya sp. A25]|eukprot:GSA25T00012771001.1